MLPGREHILAVRRLVDRLEAHEMCLGLCRQRRPLEVDVQDRVACDSFGGIIDEHGPLWQSERANIGQCRTRACGARGQREVDLISGVAIQHWNGGTANARGIAGSGRRRLGRPGDAGTGRVSMSDGATGQTASIILGNADGSSGTVTLSGSGTSLRTYGTGANGLSVANSGSGNLSVSDGAFIESDQAIVGRNAGGAGSVTLSGAGTQWNGYGATTIGSSGKGTVLVQSGAHAISGSLSIGENTSSTGNEATVTGSGSLWNVYNDISLGGNVNTGGTGGEGTLSVLNGATMTASNAYIGNVSSGEGKVYVDGAGSQLQLSASLRVGRNGDGRLAVSNGGSVTADFALVGANANSTGILYVTDAGSEMTLTNRMTVGATGEGLLGLENGGTLNSNGGIIGRDAGSIGIVGVTGGATWNNTSNLEVGSEGSGLLDIFNGGTVTNRTVEIGTNATGYGFVAVTGTGSSWAVDGGITAGVEGDGALVISRGGVVTSTESTVASTAGSTGLAVIDGAGSSWTIDGDLTVGENGTGVLQLSDGGTLTADKLVLAANAGSTGSLVIGSLPDVAPQGPGTLDVNEVSFGDGQGYLVFNHTSSDYEFSRVISGTVDIGAFAGTTILTADNTNEGNTYIDTGAEIQVGNGGTTGTLQGNAAIETGGKLSFARSDDIEFAGLLRGTGTVSQKGPGTLRLTADNDQFAGTLEAESGTFLVDGSLRGTKADIKAGAAFGGSGEIGSTTVRTGGTAMVNVQITEQSQRDLLLMESLAIPLSFLVLVWVFGGLLAAALPVAIGAMAVIGALAVLRVVKVVGHGLAFRVAGHLGRPAHGRNRGPCLTFSSAEAS